MPEDTLDHVSLLLLLIVMVQLVPLARRQNLGRPFLVMTWSLVALVTVGVYRGLVIDNEGVFYPGIRCALLIGTALCLEWAARSDR